MSTKTYFWIEDRKNKASYIFWETFMQQLCPDVIVESKQNNSELVKAVKALKDENNKYIIIFDNSFDNLQVYQERKLLKKYVDIKRNVYVMDIICFEYILLEFDRLIDWIYAPDDEFLVKRVSANKLSEHNIEQLSAKLLFDLTRNTGFEVSKGHIGECWIKSCCGWSEREENDICGLDDAYLSVKDKMKYIFNGTSINKAFFDIELEVSI